MDDWFDLPEEKTAKPKDDWFDLEAPAPKAEPVPQFQFGGNPLVPGPTIPIGNAAISTQQQKQNILDARMQGEPTQTLETQKQRDEVAKAAKDWEQRLTDGTLGERYGLDVARKTIPFSIPDRIYQSRLKSAMDRYATGDASQRDLEIIGEDQARQAQAQKQASETGVMATLRRAGGIATSLPLMATEFGLAGVAGKALGAAGRAGEIAGTTGVLTAGQGATAAAFDQLNQKEFAGQAIDNLLFSALGPLMPTQGKNVIVKALKGTAKGVGALEGAQELKKQIGLQEHGSNIPGAIAGDPQAQKELMAQAIGFGSFELAMNAASRVQERRAELKKQGVSDTSAKMQEELAKVADTAKLTQDGVDTDLGSIPKALADILGLQPKTATPQATLPAELAKELKPPRPAQPERPKVAPESTPPTPQANDALPPPEPSNAKYGDLTLQRQILEAVGVKTGRMGDAEVVDAFAKTGLDLGALAEKPVVEPQKEATYEPPAVAAQPEPAPAPEAPMSMLDRIRAKQAGQLPQAKAPPQQTLREAPLDVATRRETPEVAAPPAPLDVNASKWDILDAAKGKLNDRQMEILNRRLEGEGLDDIAGGKVSRQAIKDAENRITKKLGLDVSLHDWLLKNRPDVVERSVARGEVTLDELKGVTDEFVGRVAKRRDANEITDKQMEALADQFIKEKSRGKLTDQRAAELEAEFTRLDQERQSRNRGRTEEPQQIPERPRPAKQPSQPSQPEAPVAQAKTLKPSGRNKAYEQEAVDLGYDLADYRGAVQMAKEMHAAEFGAHNETVREIRDRLGSVAKVAHRAEDAGALEGFKPKGGRQGQSIDEAGNDIVAGGRHVLDKNNPSESAFQKLQKGVVQDLTSKEVHDRAIAMLEDAKAFREAALGDAYEGRPQLTNSRLGEEPGDVPFKRMAKMIGRQLWEDDAGAWTVTAAVNKAAEHFSAIRDSTRRLAGQTFPATTDIDRESGEAMARKIAAKQWGREAGPFFTDLVAKDATPQDRKFLGAVSTELHLRSTKAYFEKQRIQNATNLNGLIAQMRAATNPKDREAFRLLAKEAFKTMREYEAMRDDVTTVFGMPDSPINTEPEFQQALRSPQFLDFVQKYQREVSPMLEDFYRRSLAIPQGQPIPITSQIPGFIMNLKNIDRPRPIVGNEGNLRNVRQKKLEFARTRSGASDAYDLDVGEIIANSFEKSADVAARADLDNALIKAGLAKLGFPGSVKDINGMPVKSIPFAKGERTLFVAEPVYNEYRDAINPDRSARLDYVTPAMNAVTKANLFLPAVELASHGSNLIGSLFAPKAIQGTIKSVYDKIANNDAWRKQVLELSRINAQKSHGLETPSFKYDPAQVGGKALDWVNDIIRVGLDNAFDIIVKKNPSVPNTETNRRDFINQNAGQYNRLAQNKMIRWAREFGIGPFATAASTMTVRAIRSLGGSPMIDAGGTATNLKLRSEVLGKRLAVLSIVGAANYAIWGNIMGDDKTPLGSLKVGEKPDGTTVYVDLPGATELRRGLRSTGLLSIIQGNRAGMSSGKIKDKAVEDIGHAVAHPILGPAATFAETAWTGENYFGRKIADKASDSESQKFNNFLAALKTANPFVSAVTGWDNPKEDAPWDERLSKLLGPLGPKYRKK